MLADSLPHDGSKQYLEDCSWDFWLGKGTSAGGKVNRVENGDSLPGLCVNIRVYLSERKNKIFMIFFKFYLPLVISFTVWICVNGVQ